MKLDGLAGPHQVADGDHTRVGIGPHHIADEEVTTAECVAVFACHPTDMERRPHQLAVNLIEVAIHLPQPLERRHTAELDDQVLLRLGDHKRPSDRAAALRDDRPHPNAPPHDHAHGSGVVGPRAGHERVRAGLPAAAGHPADDRHARMVLLHPLHKRVDWKRERIGQEHEGRVGRPLAGEPLGPAGKAAPLGRLHVFERYRLEPRSRQAGQPHDHGRPGLVFPVAGQNALGRGADHVSGRHEVGGEFERRPDRPAVGGRNKHHAEVGLTAAEFAAGGGDRLPERHLELRIRGRPAAAAERFVRGAAALLPCRHVTISANDITTGWSNSPPASRLPGRTASAVAMPAARAASSSAPTSLTNRICRGWYRMSAAIAV